MEKLNKKRLIVTFILYCLLVMWIILLRMNIAQYCAKYRGVFLIPFSDNNFIAAKGAFLPLPLAVM